MGSVAIAEYDDRWPASFLDVAVAMRAALGGIATRIDHIGSTAVPGLAAKDVIDVQVSVDDDAALDRGTRALADAGWVPVPEINRDHDVPGLAPNLRKRFLREHPGARRVNVHVRVEGAPNQRYSLLVRDYLRAHARSAQAYATLKRDLARTFPNDMGRYADMKDAACDLIYFAAEEWAGSVGWEAPPSDA